MTNILITGNGFIGSNLYNHLTENKSVYVKIVSRKDVDYFDEIALKKYVRENFHSFNDSGDDVVIINCSGFTGKPNVDQCEELKHLTVTYNTKLPVNLSNYCKRNKWWFINISSGCIYTGYNKDFNENDEPNFGVSNKESSFYSHTKHLAEIMVNKDVTSTLRIRMPFCHYNSERNLINKILKYDKLISYENSLTCVEDLCVFVENFILRELYKNSPGIYNVVNPGSVNARQIVGILSKYNLINPNWSFVDIDNIPIKAGRSNCVLSDKKIADLGLQLPPAVESLEKCIQALS